MEAGMTLLELVLACSILLILSSAALPIARYTIVHKKEELLRYDLRQMRDAIDRYKDLADRNLIRVEVGSEGYPPDLETLVKGVQLGAGNDRKIR
jgi:general secretion pathway protein G